MSDLRHSNAGARVRDRFAALFDQAPEVPDDLLAAEIDRVGEDEIGAGLQVDLDELLECIPGLAERAIPLDAAVSAAIRSRVAMGLSREETLADLTRSHPGLEDQILASSFLDEAFGGRSEAFNGPALPYELGPRTRDGRARYQLIELIGSGIQGGVYRAVDRVLSSHDRPAVVAVKLVRAHSAEERTEAIREATRAKRVDDPNVARVHDAGVDNDGLTYIVFDFVDGRTLIDWHAEKPAQIDADEAARLVRMLASGVAASHRAGLYHQDIHPRNVIVHRSGNPVLVDFGCGRSVFESDSGLWRKGGALGFMSPEVYRGDSGVPPHLSDIYSIGATLYWLLTGRYANGMSEPEVARALNGETPDLAPPSPAAQRSAIDPDLDALVTRALAPRPEERYQSADALVEDLGRYLRREPLIWRRHGVVRLLRLWIRRSPKLAAAWLLTTVVALVSAAVIGAVIIRTDLVREQESLRRELLRERAAARVAAAELAATQDRAARYEQARQMSSALQRLVASIDRDTFGVEWIVYLSLLVELTGPRIFDFGDLSSSLSAERLEVGERVLRELDGSDDPGGFDAYLWRAAMGTWLLRAGEYARARDVLSDADRLGAGLFQNADLGLDVRIMLATATALAGPPPGTTGAAADPAALLADVDPDALQDWLAPLVRQARQARADEPEG